MNKAQIVAELSNIHAELIGYEDRVWEAQKISLRAEGEVLAAVSEKIAALNARFKALEREYDEIKNG